MSFCMFVFSVKSVDFSAGVPQEMRQVSTKKSVNVRIVLTVVLLVDNCLIANVVKKFERNFLLWLDWKENEGGWDADSFSCVTMFFF